MSDGEGIMRWGSGDEAVMGWGWGSDGVGTFLLKLQVALGQLIM